MAMTPQTNSNNIASIAESLASLEAQIAKLLGKEVFDYSFLFSKEDNLEVSIDQLSENAEKLVAEYVTLSNQVLKYLKIEPNKASTLASQFLENMHDIYLVRYIEAVRIYAEYQLVRIPTRIEQDLVQSMDVPDDQKYLPSTVTFAIPDAFIVDELGEIDIQNTLAQEQQTHTIKSYLSTVAELDYLRERLLKDFSDITEYGFVPMFYKEELLEMNELLIQVCLLFFTGKVYEYISAGRTPIDAKSNVRSYFEQITRGNDSKFPPQLESLEQELVEILEESLKGMSQLTPATRNFLLEEYKELLLFMINSGDFLPMNFYQLQLREAKDYRDYDKKFNIILDLYLILDNGKILAAPIESYNIDFTAEAKTSIFEAVAGDVENPRFTLVDYLSENS